MRRFALPFLVLLVFLLAGCAQPHSSPAAGGESNPATQHPSQGPTATAPREAASGKLDLGTPLVLPVASGPETNLTAFLYRLPAGAVLTDQPIKSEPSYVVKQVVLAFAPDLPTGLAIDQWSLQAYRIDDHATFLTQQSGVVEHGIFSDGLTTGASETNVTFDPGFLRIGASNLQDGDTLGLVVAAKSATPASFSLYLSPMAKYPRSDNSAPGGVEDLLNNRTAVRVEPRANGTGFQWAYHDIFNFLLPPFISHDEYGTDGVQVTDTANAPGQPVASLRLTTMSTHFPKRGFSIVSADYFAYEYVVNDCPSSAVTYDLQVDLHGTKATLRNAHAGESQAEAATGTPDLYAIAEGDGEASATLTIQGVTSCTFEDMALDEMDLGATLQDLFGVPASTTLETSAGLLGNIPPASAAE